MYDSTIGRFLEEDPTGVAGGDANFYRYCGNGPTDRTDPSGPSGLSCDSVEAAAWHAAEIYAVQQGWGVSAQILHYFNDLSNSGKYAPGKWGPTLDLSGTPVANKIGKIEAPRIFDAIKRLAATGAKVVPMTGRPRRIVRDEYKVVYDKAGDPDLYWGLHGVTIKWTAEIQADMPKQLPDGSYSVTYRIYAVSASLEDDFDFNPGQFKNFPAKQLNDIGASKGVPFTSP